MLTWSGERPSVDDPLEVGLGESGQRGEVPVEERQPVVVVLQIEALPQAGRQLVDEAELAVVVAGADLVEDRARRTSAPSGSPARFSASRVSSNPPRRTSISTSGSSASRRHRMGISRHLAVQPEHLVARSDAGALGRWHRARQQRLGAGSRRQARCSDRPPPRASLDGGGCRAGAAASPPRLLRRRGDGDQGAGLDGPRLRAAPSTATTRSSTTSWWSIGSRPWAWSSSTRSPRCRTAPRSCSPPTGPRPPSSRKPAPRARYVVDSVCPLVTKVHHEVKVRTGKGYRIVYVGHDGHEEAVGTMAVAPDRSTASSRSRRGSPRCLPLRRPGWPSSRRRRSPPAIGPT